MHCWTGKLEWITETYGDLSDEYCEYVTSDEPKSTCMLPADHSGPHVWTPDSEITLVFRDAPPGDGSDGRTKETDDGEET